MALYVQDQSTMTVNSDVNWQSIINIVAELKRCDEEGIVTASIAMAFICIDTLANLSRPIEKQRSTRSDFKEWVDTHLKSHPDQPYKYRGKDVYAARCAFLHTYGSEASPHEDDPDTIRFIYSDGGKHIYDSTVESDLAIIGTKSFINDVVHAVDSFLNQCKSDLSLKKRVEERLPSVLLAMPYPDGHT